jgi:hypothetical protein
LLKTGGELMIIVRIIAGGALLTLGRKLFWLFVAGVGFFTAIDLLRHYLLGQPDWLVVVLAVVAGLIGALLAVFFQSLAIWLAGFIGGGYFAISSLSLFGIRGGFLTWIVFFIGGILGGILLAVLFDWALIILSSIGGAAMISQALPFLGRPMGVILFIGLSVVGIIFQGIILSGEKRTHQANP